MRPRVGDRRKRSDPATTPARLRNADQERECAPREAEGKIWRCLSVLLLICPHLSFDCFTDRENLIYLNI
ncbi:MAG: hypothetical protein F6K34_15530 [Okeania sp. SIO4D6]|nr:hypothetical protein [Okeania sp. SIO4D6]